MYFDETRAGGPSAHALIVGVAAYKAPKLQTPLTTTTLSARAVADWFVGGRSACFHNDECPWGSVAVLLSEPATTADGRSVYAEGAVPRASFEATRACVRSWVTRMNTNKDSLAFLYVASHGESYLNRSAFLLEDYGVDSLDATAGMSEVEQFVSALENATPTNQLLLFDCCRTPADISLPWNTEYGTKLIALTRQLDDHGEPRKQWVIAATSLGEVATGRKNNTTLFADALISALNGVASDPSEDDWPVRPGVLVDKIDRLLALHRLPGEKAQTPSGRHSGSFNITCPGESEDVPVYISLQDAKDWAESVITIVPTPGNSVTIEGAENEPPFQVLRFPALTQLQVIARKNNVNFARATGKTRAPAVFMELKKEQEQFGIGVDRQLRRTRSIEPIAEIRVILVGWSISGAACVAEIVSRENAADCRMRFVFTNNNQISATVSPGEYTITLRTPNGRVQTCDVTAEMNHSVAVQFLLEASPHEWLASAVAVGAIRDIATRDVTPDKGVQAPAPVTATINGFVEIGLARHASPVQLPRIAEERDDGRLMRFGIVHPDPAFTIHDEGPRGRPLFAHIAVGAREELAVIPSLGSEGQLTEGGWRPYVVVDRRAPPDAAMSSVIVEDRVWSGLLGFLASRDMATGNTLIDSGMGQAAVRAMLDKASNSLAATAGALVAVAGSNPRVEKLWDPWLRNLANWFPGLPDGPIILARRLLIRARNAEDVTEARKWYLDGYRRGVPVYSLSVDWLARGLESITGEDPNFAEERLAARGLANRVDPTYAFTVIRIAG